MKRWFITGTDTEIGKTRVACAWIRMLVARGERVAAMKPVASGCVQAGDGLRSEDALALLDATNVSLEYQQVNPYAYAPPIAPHIAAAQAGEAPNPSRIAAVADAIEADHLVIEGVGGWCVPLSEDAMLADLVRLLRAEVILVVGMRLGCINHALLSAAKIAQDDCVLAGWVANRLDPDMAEYGNNRKTLEKYLQAPLLAALPWEGKTLQLRSEIDLYL